ncbi:MAG: YraN family protein [Leptolyngbyaceae cyanobacterium SL_5_14]|nr:YraN family protein [Leptolyngbyaceae cyanobacterium SL_5_14]
MLHAAPVNASSPNSSQPAKPGKPTQTIGVLAEDLVADWLIGQGWEVLQRRWHCRWGELDLVAKGFVSDSKNATPQPTLAFIEVKARSRGNWDANGLLSITLRKQAKLWQAAQLFLAEQPELAELPCRFDVALVSYGRSPVPSPSELTPPLKCRQHQFLNKSASLSLHPSN